MNEIILNNTDMPVVNLCNHLIAHKSFYHKDRIAPFHILIYVIKGTIYVTEDKIDYEIHPGELIFLKSGIRHYGKQEIKIGTEWHFVHFCYDMPADSICNNTCTRTLPKTLSGLSGSKLASHIAAFSKYAASENAYHQ